MKKMLTLLIGSFVLAACGTGTGGNGSDTVAFSNIPTGIPYNTSAAKTTAFAAGDADCPTGGILVETGIDRNGNGILDSTEVTNSQKVCNGAVGPAGSSTGTGTGSTGATGDTGLSALVNLNTEAVGANCATGGVRIESGIDSNRSSTLDTSEITITKYVCNGATGATGASGSTGTGSNTTISNEDLVGTWNFYYISFYCKITGQIKFDAIGTFTYSGQRFLIKDPGYNSGLTNGEVSENGTWNLIADNYIAINSQSNSQSFSDGAVRLDLAHVANYTANKFDIYNGSNLLVLSK